MGRKGCRRTFSKLRDRYTVRSCGARAPIVIGEGRVGKNLSDDARMTDESELLPMPAMAHGLSFPQTSFLCFDEKAKRLRKSNNLMLTLNCSPPSRADYMQGATMKFKTREDAIHFVSYASAIRYCTLYSLAHVCFSPRPKSKDGTTTSTRSTRSVYRQSRTVRRQSTTPPFIAFASHPLLSVWGPRLILLSRV